MTILWKEIKSPIPGARCFQANVPDGHLSVLVSLDNGKWHLSISHRLSILNAEGQPEPGRIPTWDEIKEARYLYCPDDKHMAMILPPPKEFVNVHPTTMHLWEIQPE